jgi:hypothetical protein
MDVKDAVRLAKAYIRDVLADEKIVDVGLEETDFEESSGQWLITIGFRRPFERKGQKGSSGTLAALLRSGGSYENRWYKTVRIDVESGKVVSMRDLVLRSAA